MIKRLVIKGLYELYSYDLKFENNPNVQIITGPNGFGKTTILQIINHFCSRHFWYFYFLPFDNIEISLDDDVRIRLERHINQANKKALVEAAVV